MGCIYTAYNRHCSKNGLFKIGQTKHKYPTSRFNNNNLNGLFFIQCPNATYSELLLLEAVARCTCEQIKGFERLNYDSTDWFSYEINTKQGKSIQAESFAMIVMQEVVKECTKRNIDYTLKTCSMQGVNFSCVTALEIEIINNEIKLKKRGN